MYHRQFEKILVMNAVTYRIALRFGRYHNDVSEQQSRSFRNIQSRYVLCTDGGFRAVAWNYTPVGGSSLP